MFVVCKNYLINTVLKSRVGIAKVEETRGPNTGNREARVYTMPERGRIEFNLNHSDRTIRHWQDWNDLDENDKPKFKRRIEVARQWITFVIELYAKTPAALNTDFNNFFRSLDKFIYDGQTAKYIENGENKTDNQGNLIQVIPGAYDFNDNKFYGDILSKVFIEVEFEGGIYLNPDGLDPRVVMDIETQLTLQTNIQNS